MSKSRPTVQCTNPALGHSIESDSTVVESDSIVVESDSIVVEPSSIVAVGSSQHHICARILANGTTGENDLSGKYPGSATAKTCLKLRRHCNIAVVSLIIVTVWMLLVLPTIFYYLPQDSAGNVDVTNMSCVPEIYTGVVCREVLQAQQSCLPDRTATDDIFIATDSASSQTAKEEQANLFIGGLPLLSPSSDCMEAVVPFLCFYIFPLCDSSGRPYQPSSAECREITGGICAQEFAMAAEFVEASQLPQCALLPEKTQECNATDKAPTIDQGTVANNTLLAHNSSLTCSKGFYASEGTGLCRPECGVWEELPHSLVVGADVVVILSAIVYLLSGTAVLVLSCIYYKRMFSFPSIFIVYSVIALGVLEVFILIGYTDRTLLFCSSRDLAMSAEEETPFCRAQGVVHYYTTLMLAIFWIFHIMITFWRIRFPFHARSFETRGYFRYIHAIMVFLATVLPLASVGAIFGTGGVTISRFPPIVCLGADTGASFYSFILPMSIISAIAIPLIIFILRILITKARSLRTQLTSDSCAQTRLKMAELKILVVFIYFFVFSVIGLTAFTIFTRNVTDFVKELTVYFSCEGQGVQPGKICERRFERKKIEAVQIMSYMLVGFYPVVNLIYVINIKKIKGTLSKYLGRNSCHT